MDVFGNCGKRECARGGGAKEDCMAHITDTYKFYLSFENSLCNQYVTEKFFDRVKRVSSLADVMLCRREYMHLRFVVGLTTHLNKLLDVVVGTLSGKLLAQMIPVIVLFGVSRV